MISYCRSLHITHGVSGPCLDAPALSRAHTRTPSKSLLLLWVCFTHPGSHCSVGVGSIGAVCRVDLVVVVLSGASCTQQLV